MLGWEFGQEEGPAQASGIPYFRLLLRINQQDGFHSSHKLSFHLPVKSSVQTFIGVAYLFSQPCPRKYLPSAVQMERNWKREQRQLKPGKSRESDKRGWHLIPPPKPKDKGKNKETKRVWCLGPEVVNITGSWAKELLSVFIHSEHHVSFSHARTTHYFSSPVSSALGNQMKP